MFGPSVPGKEEKTDRGEEDISTSPRESQHVVLGRRQGGGGRQVHPCAHKVVLCTCTTALQQVLRSSEKIAFDKIINYLQTAAQQL